MFISLYVFLFLSKINFLDLIARFCCMQQHYYQVRTFKVASLPRAAGPEKVFQDNALSKSKQERGGSGRPSSLSIK